jgi:hypothetical protein
VLLEPKEMPGVLGHEVVRVGFLSRLRNFTSVTSRGRLAGTCACAGQTTASCRQAHYVSKNLVIRPAVNLADLGQPQDGEQFLENGLGKNQLKCALQIGIDNAVRR